MLILPSMSSVASVGLASVSQPPPHCSFVSVGGGWAGIYAAWRVAIDAQKVAPSSVCIFEASTRLGGRTFTVEPADTPHFSLLKELSIDVGAYRFAFEQHLPGDLIRGPLNLTTACYIPSCAREPLDGNLTLHKLIDPRTNSSSGYSAALTAMLLALRGAGAHVVTGRRLVAVHGAPGAPADDAEEAPPLRRR